ncbi:peroxide stress protein YaaA [Falsarthrobacter nasiphocae]|uniref:Cytoplasmic iron level regulating protein YaaA (DUF328/UPF0246 family) n=1 Tax=Falsarthrobacter nasiphocae TaxID=189863 RepID=A0AAE3YJL1_9MICC|nr:peroxide stress protein YaaA [Falsarthrobacter nasiphocae]MDR6892891.1 cytoplasmic iron level regulating protein YaaA (DUF328/UPF0246 family) [Falsarthrobacter nasiphocae]
MRFLLPPSETKHRPARGRATDLAALSFPELEADRRAALEAIAGASVRDDAAAAFGVSEALLPTVRANAEWATAPSAPAALVYEGVLYSALGAETLSPAAKRRANARVLVFSAAFGVVGLKDRIPAYRASAGTKVPGLGGALNAYWRPRLAEPLAEWCGRELVVDARSGPYASMFAPAPERTVALDVLQRRGGKLAVVSHFAKHTRGQVVRDLLESGAAARTPEALREILSKSWETELVPAGKKPASLRIILPADHAFTAAG